MAKASHFVNNPVILITGGTGFAGSHLVELLKEKKEHNIHVTSHSGRDQFVSTLIDEQNIHKVDLTDKKETEDLIKAIQPDQIYHLASISSVGDSFENAQSVLNNNINLQLNLLNAVKDFAPQARVLAITSADQYEMSTKPLSEDSPIAPINPYGVSKATQDMLAGIYANLKLDIIRARPFNHIGERQQSNFAVPAFASQIAKVEKNKQSSLQVGNLNAIRDFTDVKDMVRAYLLLMQKGESGQVYNIGSGHGLKVSDILENLVRLAKVKVTVKLDPARMRPADNPFIVADNTKIAALGWSPKIPIDKTLERTLNYFRNSIGN
ncbi:MAG: NAD-dependent epimerase/dehydratase family protein [Candidatus Pacebacteria bacterium]|nr:NAD-dependent epimerase/dehydratase family protein [Candidatus Paceibacterota bacterium]